MGDFECPKDDFKTDDWLKFFEHLESEHPKDGYAILTNLVLNNKIRVEVV